jgi:hypothetical protein
MVRLSIYALSLLLLLSCKDNFIGDPAKNISPGTTSQTVIFPSELISMWYASSGTLTYIISSSSQLTYGSTDYNVIKISKVNSAYKVITQSSSSTLYYTFYFIDITAAEMYAQRSASYSSASDAESAAEGGYTRYTSTQSSPWSSTTFPSALNTSWYGSAGTVVYAISGSSTVQFSGSSHTIVAVYINGSVYKVIARSGSSAYYAFFFNNVTSLSMTAYRSGSYASQSDAETSTAGSYTSYSSTPPSPWTTAAFPSGLIKTWNTTGGSLAYTISSSSAITYSSTIYSVIATYVNGAKYKIIVRSPSPSNLYFAFFFDNITASGMTSYRSGSYTTQSAAEAAAEGTHSTYVAASASAWTSISFPSAANGGWYTSSGTLNYLFYRSSSVHWGSTQLTYISAGQNGSTYRIIMKINGGSYYVFFFTSLTSTSANIHVSSAKSTLADAEATVAGTYTAHTALWPLSAFPTSLNGTWLTASNLASYYITNGTTIETNGNSYTISATYKQGSVYKVITTWGSNYQTFYFKDVTSTVMYVYQGFAESSYLTAFNTAQGTYLYHKK